MSYLDVGMSGWHKMSLTFKIISKQEKEGVEVFKCIDSDGNEFFIENSELFAKYSRNSSTFAPENIFEVSLGEIIQKLQHNKSIFEVNFHTIEGEDRTIRGYVISPDEEFGYTKVYDLDQKGIRNVNNRGIKSLILNNSKYIV